MWMPPAGPHGLRDGRAHEGLTRASWVYEAMGHGLKVVWLKCLPENYRYSVEAWVPQE